MNAAANRIGLPVIADALKQVAKDGAPMAQVFATAKALAEAHQYDFYQGEFVCSIVGSAWTVFVEYSVYGAPVIELKRG
jgi:hypothetical protein